MVEFHQNGFDSINLYNELYKLDAEERSRLLKGVNWLTRRQLDTVLIGGMGVAHHLKNERLLTPDTDFLVMDIGEVVQKLDSKGISYNNLANSLTCQSLGIFIEEFNMDILDCEAWNQKVNLLMFETATLSKVNGSRIKVASPELLAISKLLVGRDKDVADAIALLKSPSIDKTGFQAALVKLGDEILYQLSPYVDLIGT